MTRSLPIAYCNWALWSETIKDVIWMMSVTITNLGFGDFTPSNWISRLLVSTLALFGIFQTALIVGVLSEALVIPPEEKRILASLEKQRLEKIRRNTAASLIQWAWRVYVFDQSQLGINVKRNKI